MPEDPSLVSISSQRGLHPDEIARRTFPSARRGVDAEAVRRFLETVAEELRQAGDREVLLRKRLAEAERRAEEPELDEQTLSKAVGLETGRILQAAHDAANEVVLRAEATASQLVSDAEGIVAEKSAAAATEASAIIEEAEERLKSEQEASEAEIASLRAEAEEEAREVTEAAHGEAVALLDSTRRECRRMVRQARELRDNVVGDLARRRRVLRVQLEQLRTGRDSLVEVVDAVGDSVDELRERLANAEHEARLAAAEAGERASQSIDDSDLVVDDVEVELHEGDLGEQEEGEAEGAMVDQELADYVDDGEKLDLAVDEALAGEFVDDADQGTSQRSVDELFARIRASRVPQTSDLAPGSEHEAEGVLGGHSAHEAAVEEADGESVEEEEEEEVEEEEEASIEDEGALSQEELGTPVSAEDAALLARRTEIVAPIVTRLGRALKRALQDDQNELLTALRQASGVLDLDALSPLEDQLSRLSSPSTKLLAEAFSAGKGWLDSGLEAAAPSKEEAKAAAESLASELAGEVTSLLRHRLEEALAVIGDGGDGATDAASAAYREWRGTRVESAAGDFVTRAFSWGAVSGGAGVEVRWIVDDDGHPCPDCDDNALASGVRAGDEFPTGQLHPPVHSGCRCLLVLAAS